MTDLVLEPVIKTKLFKNKGLCKYAIKKKCCHLKNYEFNSNVLGDTSIWNVPINAYLSTCSSLSKKFWFNPT